MFPSGTATTLAGVSQKLSRTSLREQAVEVLRELIVNGTIQAGGRINEAELAAELGISRGPLREGIQRLGAEGLIEFRGNRGAYVRDVTIEDAKQMYEAREVFEVAAARLATQRATETEIAELERQIAEVDALLQVNSDSAYPIDADFHKRILELSKNPYLERCGNELHAQLRIARLRSGNRPERTREALEEHRAVLVAIAKRDQEGAAEMMAKHIRNTLAALTERMANP